MVDELWVLDDVFLSFAAHNFNQFQRDGLDKHINTQYNVRFIFTLVDAERNFLLRLINALIGLHEPSSKVAQNFGPGIGCRLCKNNLQL